MTLPPPKPARPAIGKAKNGAAPRHSGPPLPSVLSAAELEAVRRRLEAKKQEIMAMYKIDLRTGQESNDSPTEDIVDRANNAYSRELSYSISDAERALMLQIDEARARVADGTYGRCAHCGEPIAARRIEALPWARHCINCQELLEKGLLGEG
jgi:DnaK suppressor protein